jgi:hypothetical protein
VNSTSRSNAAAALADALDALGRGGEAAEPRRREELNGR